MAASEGQSAFRSEVIDHLGASRAWRLAGGSILLPRVFGFCRGVTRALEMLEDALGHSAAAGRERGESSSRPAATRFYLLGPIIHNPWVNHYFEGRGVHILTRAQMNDLASLLSPEDCAVIPAFGATPAIERTLRRIGCRVIDTTCPDVRRLWAWARRSATEGRGVLIYGRADHDETLVTKAHLEAAGEASRGGHTAPSAAPGRYLVVGDLEEAGEFCRMIASGADGRSPSDVFGPGASNASSMAPFLRLAQVSQTTMLYEETTRLRDLLTEAFQSRFGGEETRQRLLFQPTVCRATQDRQTAARELCEAGCDLILVVGGFGSSNTRHLHELARRRGPAYFIEDASAIHGREGILSLDASAGEAREVAGWLPARRPLRIGVLAGASSPEAVVGEVLQRLALLLRD
jgi:4-hydroxy-3-methylbut-2-en-1-yl diphosphate reductase